MHSFFCVELGSLLHWGEEDFHLGVGKEFGDSGDLLGGGADGVEGVEYLGFDGARSLHSHIDGHRVGEVYGQEEVVYLAHCEHFGRELRITTDVDATACKLHDVAVVTTLAGVVLRALYIVGRHGLHREPRVHIGAVAFAQHLCALNLLAHHAVGDDHGVALAELLNSYGVEMVVVVVCDEDCVGLGERVEIGLTRARVEVDVLTIPLGTNRRVTKERENNIAPIVTQPSVLYKITVHSQWFLVSVVG